MKKTILILTILIAYACNTEVDQSAKEINYDRDICVNCLMGLAEQEYTAQAINEYGEVIWFDDIGCLVEYAKTDNWKKWGGENAKAWIGNCETGKWIDAYSAFYRFGDRTPMGYGYGALKENLGDTLFDYKTTVKRIEAGKTMREEFIKEKKMMHHMDKDKNKDKDSTAITE